MIEFPTDAKFSNIQLKPNSNETLSYNLTNSILKKVGSNWTVPYELIPFDYARISVNKDLAYVSTLFAKDIDAILDINTNTYNLKVGGVYRLVSTTDGEFSMETPGGYISDNVDDNLTNVFYNTPAGFEITKSVEESTGNKVYTIAPKIEKNRTEITIGLAKFNINVV